jgi:hypothetical protein
MRLLDRLERWLGRFAVPHLTLILILCQIVVYAAMFGTTATDADMRGVSVVAERLQLVPARVLEGEVWRLFSFVIIPPFENIVFAFFGWYFFWMMGTALENEWGTFRYNVFLLVGWLATVAVSFLLPYPDQPASPLFWQGSVFLAFAYLYPEFVIYLFFILPIRIKWLALLTWLGYGFGALVGNWNTRLLILAAVLNFLLFFGWEILQRMGMGRRHMLAQLHAIGAREPAYHHCCRICGITDRTHRDMDFRYCSKCEGSCCYCAEHLKNHEHVVAKT